MILEQNTDPEEKELELPDDELPAPDQDDASVDEEQPDETQNEPLPEESATDEISVSIGDEPLPEEPAQAPEWVRNLRKSNREKDRIIRENQSEIARLKGATAPAPATLGAKPTLESCDYDAEKFEEHLESWHTRKRQVDEETNAAAAKQQQAEAAWKAQLSKYEADKKGLKVRDFEDAEGVVQDGLSVMQQGVILNGAENAALLVYALGKNPAKAKQLASIEDPVKFAFAVAKLESQLKVTPKKSVPPPERVVRSNVAGGGAVDNQLERLRDEARKTGNADKLHQYRMNQRKKTA